KKEAEASFKMVEKINLARFSLKVLHKRHDLFQSYALVL
ncbi:MAG: hypothetical protein ACI8QY_001074, partial [bacterium]